MTSMPESRTLTPGVRFLLNVGVPFLYLLPLLVAWFSPKHFGFGVAGLVPVALAVGFLGWLLWVAATFKLGSALAVLPGASHLVAAGVYKYIRHPIYVGIFFTLLGLLAACGSTFGVIYVFVVVLPLNVVRARLEERALLRQFGEGYRAYLDRTWF